MDGYLDAVVVGAGQAGIAASQALARRGADHVVLERGLIGDTWRTRRWDSFRMVTQNWMNALPGQAADRPTEFATAGQFVDRLTAYVRTNALPVRENMMVVSARPRPSGFVVDTVTETFFARSVVVTSGFQWQPRIPAAAESLPSYVLSVHSSAYRRPALLPEGAVVVVGSGQSGCQIALELARAGRRVYLCTSRVRRLPRRHRGRDAFVWWREMGILDQSPEALADPGMTKLPQPVLSGAEGGRSISLHQLARAGVTLLGRLVDIDTARLMLADDRDDNVGYADESAAAFRREIDEYINGRELVAPEPEPDPADRWFLLGSAHRTLDLARHGVRTVLWCTGHVARTPWLGVPDTHPDVHVIGRPWLTHRSSGILYGMSADAERLVPAITGA